MRTQDSKQAARGLQRIRAIFREDGREAVFVLAVVLLLMAADSSQGTVQVLWFAILVTIAGRGARWLSHSLPLFLLVPLSLGSVYLLYRYIAATPPTGESPLNQHLYTLLVYSSAAFAGCLVAATVRTLVRRGDRQARKKGGVHP